ncbi:MAG TPA: ECF-type sigma factor [Gemmatimonadaceae bacterium]|nr:ECF-type sigma factor [Gemmatimonadaceae bacterium]
MSSRSRVTELLRRHSAGDRAALDEAIPLLYEELRRVARRQLRREDRGHTLSTTALVNEAYLRLADLRQMEWQDRAHFLAMAARAMRRVLVDHARRHRADKRGGGEQPVSLEEALIVSGENMEMVIAVDDALSRLGALSPRLAQVVEYRFFGGMTEEEMATALGVTPRTVQRDWVKARGWLRETLGRSAG